MSKHLSFLPAASSRVSAAVALAIVSLIGAPSASAAPLYWDSNGTTAGAGTTPTGTWGTSTFWSTDSGGNLATGAYAAGSDVFFSAGTDSTGATITTSNQSANSLTIEEGAYTFTNGGILTLGNATTGNTLLSMASGAGAVTFNGQVSVASAALSYTIDNSSANLLTFGGIFAAPGGSQGSVTTVNITGSGGVTFNGGIQSNGTGNPGQGINFNVSGSNIVTLAAVNTTPGSFTVGSTATLNINNNNALQAMGLVQNGGTVNFGTGITAPFIGGIGGSGGNISLTNGGGGAVNATIVGTGSTSSGSVGLSNPTYAGTISGLGGLTFSGVTTGNRATGGTETLNGILSFSGALTVGSDTPTFPGANANGGNTLVLTAANTISNTVTVNAGTAGVSKLTISGANGSINQVSTINVNGGILNLDYIAGNTDRISDTAAILLGANAFGGGASAIVTGNATTNTTETVGAITLGANSAETITIGSATGMVTTLAASSLTRNSGATVLVRGTSLDQSQGTNVSRLTLGTAPSGSNFVGSNTISGGATNDATQALKIVPWLIGDTAVAGNGSNFVTYDTTLGLRVLNATEGTTLGTGSTTAANPVNAFSFNGTVTTPGLTVNSLLFKAGTNTLNGSGALTVNSGAVAAVANNGVIGSGFSSLALGNGEGVITATSGNTFTINTPISVTSSGGLIKAGAGTLVLGAANTYSGVTTINQGTVNVGNGTAAGDLGSSSGVTLNAASALTFNRTNTFSYTNAITGSGSASGNTLTQAGTGALTLGAISGVQTITQSAATGLLTTGAISNAGAITLSAASGATLGNITTATTITRSAGAGSLTTGTITGIGTLTDNSTTGSTTPTTLNQSGSGRTIATLNGASGSQITFGGDGTGSTTITNTLGTAGQLISLSSGTLSLSKGRGTATNIQVDGGTLLVQGSGGGDGANSRFGMNGSSPTAQTFALNGGTVTVDSTSNFGVRFNGDNGGNAAGVAGNIFSGTQTGGVFNIQRGGTNTSFNLGSTSTTTSTYALSGGTLNIIGNGTDGSLLLGADTAGTGKSTFTLSGGKLLVSGNTATTGIWGGQGTGARQAFVWTGGTLATGAYTATNLTSSDGALYTGNVGTLTNAGGILAPGDIGTAGRTIITGNYNVTSANATLALDLGGITAATVFQGTAAQYDNLSVTGATTLGGRLNINLTNGYVPLAATNHNIIVGTTAFATGSFTNQVTATGVSSNRVVLADGLSSFLIATNTTGATATVGGLTGVPVRTTALGGYSATNTYSGAGTAWDAGSASSWTSFDPGSSTGASGAIAQFADGTASTGAINVALGVTRNVRGIQFSSASGSRAYTISQGGSGAIILDNTGNSAPATIADTSASGTANAINVPITLNSDLAVSVTNAGNTLTVGGVISDGSTGKTLTKSGAGTLILSGANTYTGATTISAGTLSLAGPTSSLAGDLSVAGGNLDLNGTSVGVLTLALNRGFTFSAGSFGLSLPSNSSFDKIIGSGTGTFSITGGTFDLGGTVTDYISTYNILTGFTSGAVSGLSFTGYDTTNFIAAFNTSGQLSFTAVPEPNAPLLLAAGGVALWVFRRRRQMSRHA